MNHPDPKLHLQISLIKSVLRIIAGILLFCLSPMAAGVFLILAEALGIIEELV